MCAGNLEVKSKAPNGINFNVKGKSSHEGSTSGSVRTKSLQDVVEKLNDRLFRLRANMWMHPMVC